MASSWGGKRRNAGRRMGSKNRVPRPRKEADRLRAIVSEIEEADYLIANDDKEFKGSSFEFLQSVMRAEQLPIKVRLYAAKEVLGYEPHVAEDCLLDAVFASHTIMSQLENGAAERCRKSDAQLGKWIEEGRLSAETAILVRNLFAGPKDPPWERCRTSRGKR